MISEINLQQKIYQTMVWFGMAFVISVRALFNLIKLVQVVHWHAALPGLESQ